MYIYANTWILHQYGLTVTGWCSNEDIMVLGGSSPEALLNSMWFNNSVHFGLRGVQKHYQLRYIDVILPSFFIAEIMKLAIRLSNSLTGIL
jgi:hypothetical protein